MNVHDVYLVIARERYLGNDPRFVYVTPETRQELLGGIEVENNYQNNTVTLYGVPLSEIEFGEPFRLVLDCTKSDIWLADKVEFKIEDDLYLVLHGKLYETRVEGLYVVRSK
jgi:hypothetical protein